MAIEIDIARPLRTPGQLAALVQAIRLAAPEDETHWLEWKSDVDLSNREWLAKVARDSSSAQPTVDNGSRN
jgi:hypothetical protein